MRQSQLFTTTKQNSPKDEVAKNADLLIRAGYINKQFSGVYAFLPLGLKVLNNIIAIIRDEMNKAGGQEILLSALQEKSIWEATNRWDNPEVDAWFKTELKNGTSLGLGLTHEEPIAKTLSEYITSYKQLPVYPYQIQLKFRNETRAKSGIMRTREFLMKDLYSLSKDANEHDKFYDAMKKVYENVFTRCGIGESTFLTYASGGMFAPFSHEFQTISEAGEDVIYVNKEKGVAINKEVYTKEIRAQLGVTERDLVKEKSIEVGNIFTLGTKYSEALKLTYKDEQGKEKPVFMGSYGIGPARLMGTIVEVLSDKNGIVWPTTITPFKVHLISIGKNKEIIQKGEALYTELQKNGIEVFWDDRDESPGKKFKDADLIGIPLRVVISEKTKNKLEVKLRAEKDSMLITQKALEELVRKTYV